MKKLATLLICTLTLGSQLSPASTFTIDAGHAAGKVSPLFCGLMTEEINHSYDGGLYAELIQNRAFLDNSTTPVHWSVVANNGAEASIVLDASSPLNDKLTTSLRLRVTKAAKENPAGVANSGYWGIPVQPKTTYSATILAGVESNFPGPVTVSIVSEDGRTVYASGKFTGLTTGWKKFEVTLKTGKVVPTTKARFQITLDQPGMI